MKYARVPRPDSPPGGLSAGIDWAGAGHAVCVVDAAGRVVSRFGVEHTAEGLRILVQRLAKSGACEVAIERGDGPVVDALLQAGVTVVVITPRQVKNLRSRYGPAGNKDDRFDACVLADVLRTALNHVLRCADDTAPRVRRPTPLRHRPPPRPCRDQPPRQPGPAAQCRSNQPTTGRRAPRRARPGDSARSRGPAIGWTRGVTTQLRPLPQSRLPGPVAEAAAPAGTRHRRCLSPAACPAACAAGSVSSGCCRR